MKVDIKQPVVPKPAFKPFQIVLTIENKEDADAFDRVSVTCTAISSDQHREFLAARRAAEGY